MNWRGDSILTALLLSLSAWALAGASGVYWYALLLSGALGLVVATGFRLPGPPRSFWAILLTVPFALWMRYMPREGLTGIVPIDWLLLIGMYGVALGLYLLLSGRGAAERFQALATAVFSFGLAGAVPRNPLFVPLLIVFVPGVLWELRLAQHVKPETRRGPRPWARYVVVVLLTLAATGLFHVLVLGNLHHVNRWLTQWLVQRGATSTPGFSRQAHLGTILAVWQGAAADEVMLRQWSDQPEEYLRGAVFQTYQTASWTAVEEAEERKPEEDTDRGRNLFSLTGVRAGKRQAIIYPTASLADTFFLPLGTARLSAFENVVRTSVVSLTARSPTRRSAAGYGVFEPRVALPPPTDADLAVPEDLRPALRRIAQNIGRGEDMAAVKVGAVAGYLAQQCQYELGVAQERGKDPVLSFLETTRRGHCEYFASAGVLLLRTMGIPARYVTGFVCVEHAAAGLTLARRKDAHAWVEVYLPEKGAWIVFDPTPAQNRPQPMMRAGWERWWEAFKGWLGRVWSILTVAGVLALLSVLWESLAAGIAATPIYVWVGVAFLLVGYMYRNSWRRLWQRRQREIVSPRVRAWRRRLRRAERLAGRYGVRRGPGTTVGAYRQQVRQASMPEAVKREVDVILADYQAQRFQRAEE